MDSRLDFDIMNQFIRLLQSRFGILIKNHQYSELQKTLLHASTHFHLDPDELLNKISVCQDNDPIF